MGKQLKCNHSTQEITMGKFCGRNTDTHTRTHPHTDTQQQDGVFQYVATEQSELPSQLSSLFSFELDPGMSPQTCLADLARAASGEFPAGVAPARSFTCTPGPFLSRQDGATHSTPRTPPPTPNPTKLLSSEEVSITADVFVVFLLEALHGSSLDCFGAAAADRRQ